MNYIIIISVIVSVFLIFAGKKYQIIYPLLLIVGAVLGFIGSFGGIAVQINKSFGAALSCINSLSLLGLAVFMGGIYLINKDDKKYVICAIISIFAILGSLSNSISGWLNYASPTYPLISMLLLTLVPLILLLLYIVIYNKLPLFHNKLWKYIIIVSIVGIILPALNIWLALLFQGQGSIEMILLISTIILLFVPKLIETICYVLFSFNFIKNLNEQKNIQGKNKVIV